MERIRKLDRYQKGILLFLAAMLVVFTAAYFVVSSRVGLEYMDSILIPATENGSTVYTGKIQGQEARFTVSPENSVTFHYGETMYGPYRVIEDPTAVPEGHPWTGEMTGVEIRREDEVLFRGGYFEVVDFYALYHEDGSPQAMVTITNGDGTTVDSEGNIVDAMEPSVETILNLVKGPELTHKGQWEAWFLSVFVSIAIAVSMLFADELFRWNLAFQIRNVDRAEPSDWEISSRYIGWTVLPILALILYIMGLQ